MGDLGTASSVCSGGLDSNLSNRARLSQSQIFRYTSSRSHAVIETQVFLGPLHVKEVDGLLDQIVMLWCHNRGLISG